MFRLNFRYIFSLSRIKSHALKSDQKVTASRSKLPYASTSDHEQALAKFKLQVKRRVKNLNEISKDQKQPAWSNYGKWESGGAGDRAVYDSQLNELKKMTSPVKSDYKTPTFSPPPGLGPKFF